MYTSMLLIALTVQTSSEGAKISWSQDYTQGQKQCAAEQKPMAVILGKGDQGFDQLVSEGGLSNEASDLLSTHYVCVYVDTTTPSGKKLADAFEMKTGTGIVISDRTGVYERYRFEGVMVNSDLANRLKIYTTSAQMAPPPPASVIQPAASYCPNCQGGGTRYRR